MLGNNARALKMLETVARKSGWSSPLGSGRACGMALCQCFGSIVGEVVEVSGSATNVRVTEITVAFDCGSTINPDTVRAQVESAVLQGISAALWGDMPFEPGALPPVAPALVNARAKLGSGPRRTLPLFRQAVPATS